MVRRFYLIDGYNLLHEAGFARAHYGPGDLHRARTRLLALLVEYLDDDSRDRIEIIFDAQDPPPDRTSEMRVHGMRVRYSIETGDADALIEEIIREHSAPKQLWVVSSDHRLIDAAVRRRARSLTSEAFLDRLFEGRLERRPRQPSSTKPEEPPAATADWLEFFGLDPASPIIIDADQPGQTLPPIVIPTAKEPPPPRQNHPARTASGDSDTGEDEPPIETDPASWAAEAAFWQRRIDELFDEPSSDLRE